MCPPSSFTEEMLSADSMNLPRPAGLGKAGPADCLRSTGMLALGASVPTPLMVWWAVGFTVLRLLYAIRAFRRRAL